MAFDPVWEKIHKNTEWGKYPSEQLIRWTFQNFDLPPKKRRDVKILDFGCGQGAATLFLASEGFSVTGVDGSHSAIDKLDTRLVNRMLQARLVCADLGKTHIQEEFDGLVDIVSLAHNENLNELVLEMHRLLKPGGKLFSVIPTTDCYRLPFLQKGSIAFLSEGETRSLFEDLFTFKLGWVKELLHSGDTLAHWIISGVKR